MWSDTRARLTVPDVVYIAATLFLLGVLAPVFMKGLNGNLGDMSKGTVWLFRLLLPLLVLVFLSAIFRKAVGGS